MSAPNEAPSVTLKPCPRCQSPAEYEPGTPGYISEEVSCSACELSFFGSPEEWNTRSAEAAAEIEALRAEYERLREALADPNAVHVNLLRGDIARPTVHQMIHIYSPAKVRNGLETYASAALKEPKP